MHAAEFRSGDRQHFANCVVHSLASLVHAGPCSPVLFEKGRALHLHNHSVRGVPAFRVGGSLATSRH